MGQISELAQIVSQVVSRSNGNLVTAALNTAPLFRVRGTLKKCSTYLIVCAAAPVTPAVIHKRLLCAFDAMYLIIVMSTARPSPWDPGVCVLHGLESPTHLPPDLINSYRASPGSPFPFFSPYLSTHAFTNLLLLAQNGFLAE